ncbi:MAG: InlB B-repeat-containing protein [Bacilli bacterium]|nr:InlB B-repeat-containing protein [Bacilli bacterium]
MNKNIKLKKNLFISIVVCFLILLASCGEEVIIPTYTVTFNSDGAVVHTITVDEGTPLELASDPVKENHKFVGWFDEAGTQVEKGLAVTKDMNLTAKFEVNKYVITLDYNDGTGKKEELTYEYGAKISKFGTPTRTGYSFVGWYIGDERFDYENMPGTDLTVTAKWSLDETVITFKSNGGSTVAQIIALPGSPITEPKKPYRAGCTFLGWYLNDELFVFDVMPSESITLEAKWQGKDYTITYELNGGTCDNLITTYSSAREGDIELPRPKKEGYSFMGWYVSASFNRDPIFKIPYGTNKNYTLYAKWVETKTKELKTVGIYGDSISTYEGYVPDDALFYYPTASATVRTVEKTWWRLLQHMTGLELITNASYSTSPVCGTSSICGVNGGRIKKLINSYGEAPDIIIITMGANDIVNGFSPERFEEEYCLMLDRMKEVCPNSEFIICNILYNTCTEGQNPDPRYDAYEHPGLRAELNEVLARIAEKYGCPLVDLSKLISEETDTPNNWYYLGDNMHPSDKGMEIIAEEIAKTILEIY